MIENKIAADARIEHTAATPAIHVDKYTNNSRGFHQKRVLSLLQRGEKLSAADITVALHVSDPRSHIRDLRAKGVIISDEWVKAVSNGISSERRCAMNKRNSFVFYRSFRAAMEGLLPSEYQMFMNAIVVYGLDRTLPDLPPDLSRIFYDYCYPQLEADWVKWERRQARKGGTR